ncbi:MAG: hypothetical protein TREMPRED_005537 [Tremellales sp. Tagirdzhanova-0007]|nr:MAG: hypothetical protein TREMPRED_005537 [Tremellales sp. Tagirdzhanova-0007]
MSSALAASSSLSAYSTSHPSKRARPSSSKTSLDSSVDGDDSDDEVDPKDLSEEARAKAARKAARTIRNRESAQRSRNQRKSHLAYLESRVAELEKERLTWKTDPSSFEAQSEGHLLGGPDPANDALTPRKFHADDVSSPSSPVLDRSNAVLRAENVELNKRVGVLENLVKQAFALKDLSCFNSTTMTIDPNATSLNQSTASVDAPFDWNTVFSQPLTDGGDHAQLRVPAAGEDLFGLFRDDCGTVEQGGADSVGVGESQRMDRSMPATIEAAGQMWFGSPGLETSEAEGEGWDEAMKSLLEDLEGQQDDVTFGSAMVDGKCRQEGQSQLLEAAPKMEWA